MYLQQNQLFWGVSQEFLKRVMSVAKLVSFQPGDVVFQKNDPAGWFYNLIKGEIKICPNDSAADDCAGACTGDAFGWDSLIEQDRYRTNAICMRATVLLKISRTEMDLILAEDPYNAAIFYRHLARALGDCLMTRCRGQKEAPADDTATMNIPEMV